MKYNLKNGTFYDEVENAVKGRKQLNDIIDLFIDSNVPVNELEQIVYEVEVNDPYPGQEGALQFGTSKILPGTVNGEFFMTKGHFHMKKNRGEYYVCLSGLGLLLLQNEAGDFSYEKLTPEKIVNIPGGIAHRLVNIGNKELIVMACWNSDAGHDYSSININGFKKRVYFDEKKGYILK